MKLYEQITNYFIDAMAHGELPWQAPWKSGGTLEMPSNATTGNHYRGINIPLLWASAQKNGYSESEWATYKQWSEAGQQVDKGQKGSLIVYYGEIIREEEEDAQKIPFLKASFVFNKAQLKGYEMKSKEPQQSLVERIENADIFIKNTGAIIEHDKTFHASYSPKHDKIFMPEPDLFVDTDTQTATEGYYATTLHELTHWTGHEKRNNRDLKNRFGDKGYAFEELVAELGSAFLCAKLEITDGKKPNHGAYLYSWLQILKEDSKAILTAASQASKAVDFVQGLQPKPKLLH